MPLLKLETTVVLTDDKQQALLASLSKILAETTGKPEQYVMVTANQVAMQMAGKPGDAGKSSSTCPTRPRRKPRNSISIGIPAGMSAAPAPPCWATTGRPLRYLPASYCVTMMPRLTA